MNTSRFKPASALMDRSWRKARIAARILLRSAPGPRSSRDRAWAARLAHDPAVTNRLLDQAVSSLRAAKKK
jgi:hypothetical protein